MKTIEKKEGMRYNINLVTALFKVRKQVQRGRLNVRI